MRITRRHRRIAWAALLGAIALFALFVRDIGIGGDRTWSGNGWIVVAIAAIAVVIYRMTLRGHTRTKRHRIG